MIFLFISIFVAIVGAAPIVTLKNLTHFETFASRPTWLLEFYAPWCNHCQRLESVLEKVNDYSNGAIDFAKVDATKNRDVASKFGVNKYPTIYYKHQGVIGKYEGGRDFISFTNFVDALNKPALIEVTDVSDLGNGMSISGYNASFVFGLPLGCSSKSGMCSETLSHNDIVLLGETMKFHTHLAKWKEFDEKSLSLCKFSEVIGEEKPMQVVCASQSDLISTASIESFIRINNYPLVSELEAHNFRVLAHLNKTMVIAVIDFQEKDCLRQIKQALTNTAKRFSSHDPSSIIFGYLDGIRWKKFSKHHEVIVPAILIADHDNERHAVVSLRAVKHEDYESVLNDTIENILDNSIQMKPTEVPSLWRKVLHRIERYGWLSFLLFFSPILFLVASQFFPHPAKKEKQH